MNPMLISAAIDKAPQIMNAQQQMAKTGLKVLGVVSVGVTAYLLYRKFVGSTKDSPGNNLGQLKINKSNLNYGESVYGTMAQKLYIALDQTFGYNSTDVFSVLNSMRNTDDLLMLIKSFGIRRYGVVTALWFGDDFNLIGWLSKKLNDSDKQKAGTIFRALGVPF